MSATQGTLGCCLPPKPGAHRTSCACGCGVWFYAEKKTKPTIYLNAEHYARERNRRRREGVRRCEDCGDLLPPYPGRGPMKTCERCSARTESAA